MRAGLCGLPTRAGPTQPVHPGRSTPASPTPLVRPGPTPSRYLPETPRPTSVSNVASGGHANRTGV